MTMLNKCVSSGLLTASGVVYAGPCEYWDLTVVTDLAHDATATIYDNAAAAAGTVVDKLIVPGSWGSNMNPCPTPVHAANGLYLTLSGVGAGAIVYYEPSK